LIFPFLFENFVNVMAIILVGSKLSLVGRNVNGTSVGFTGAKNKNI
jgi:hypothetical protein